MPRQRPSYTLSTRNRKPKRLTREAEEQSKFITFLEYQYQKYRPLVFVVPNGGYRHPGEGASMKRQGVLAGVWDIFVSIPNKHYHGLYIEFKWGKNKLTDEQKVFGDNVRRVGYRTDVCYSFEAAKLAFENYIKDIRNADDRIYF